MLVYTTALYFASIVMFPPTSILVCGNDASLLEVRRWALERQNSRVHTTYKLTEVVPLVVEADIDLIIFCHTLSPDEISQTLATVRQLRPTVKRLILTSHAGKHSSNDGSDIFDVATGPEAFIKTVECLLTQ